MSNTSLLGAYAGQGGDGLMFRNVLINGDMRIAQRGTSTTNATSAYVYSLDRWRFYGQSTTGSATVTQEAFTIGQVDVPNEPDFFLRWNQTATPAGAVALTQPVEGVRTFAGQQVTLSFYAKANSARSITTRLTQNFGTGGSTAVSVNSSSISLTTSWQKYTVTFSLASISGKTIGANNYLDCLFVDSNASTFTIDIAQVQLEAGAVATPFERRPYGAELALCQRYYEKSYDLGVAPGSNSNPGRVSGVGTASGTTSVEFATVHYRVPKRIAVQPVIYNPGGVQGQINLFTAGWAFITNLTAAIDTFGDAGFEPAGGGGSGLTAGGIYGYYFHWTSNAEL